MILAINDYAAIVWIEEMLQMIGTTDEDLVEADIETGSTKGGANKNLEVWKQLVRRAHREVGI
jgi:hypothetical protein